MLIVLDLDDTLLNSEMKISEKSIETLRRLQNQGHKIMISTLRSLKRTKHFVTEINADYVSCFLGNLLLDSQGNVLKNNALSAKDFSEIISDFKNVYDGWVGFETDKHSVIANKDVAEKYDGVDFLDETEILPILNSNSIYKISFSCVNDDGIIEKFKALAKKYGCSYKFSRGFRYCDLIPFNTEKVNAIKYVKNLHPEEKVVVFGDDKSDIESIKFADIGVCMKNGLDEVKACADYVALSNNEDGVSEFLENLMKNLEPSKTDRQIKP